MKLLRNSLRYPAFPQSDPEIQELGDEFQDVLTDTRGIFHELEKPVNNDELDQKPKSSTRFLLDEARHNDSWKYASWNGYSLPAQGDPYRSCQKWFIKGCLNHHSHPENKHYIQMIEKQCARSSCPLCVESWTNRIANRMTRRLKKWNDISKSNVSHVVISLPARLYTASMTRIKKELKQVMKECGIYASAKVLHAWRFESQKAMPYISPHYHVLAFGWIKNTAEIYEKTGFLIKKISTLKNEVDYFRTSKYLLTHCAVKSGSHAVTYSGAIAYSKLKIEKEEVEPITCPYCPLELVNLRIIPQSLDKPPPFDIGFTGLTSFSGLEPITDYDYHYYDESWNVVSSKQEAQIKKAQNEDLKRIEKIKNEKMIIKSRNEQKLPQFA